MAESIVKQVVPFVGNSYCKLPDGTMIAHGAVTFPNQSAGQQTVNVTFPEPFVGYNPDVIVSWCDSLATENHMGILLCTREDKTFATLGTIRKQAGYAWYARWIAIGRWK